jgi:predicted nucleotidyltransferase component of viral defense system
MSVAAYREQVSLLLRVLPIIGREEVFALKGGTAINLFVRDLPRLSVDIDLTFLPLVDRVAALTGIHEALKRVESLIKRQIPGTTVHASRRADTPKLFIDARGARVTVEPNVTLRGSVFPPREARTVPTVETEFEQSVSTRVLSLADLYGGKLVAALDRQHPRDLFDVKILLEAEGLTNEIRTAFLGYLVSHSRPIAELLDPKLKPLERLFESQLAGMIRSPVTCRELEATRDQLIRGVRRDLSASERAFLVSLKRGEPQWELIPVPHLREMPAIQWKLRNVQQLATRRRQHDAAVRRLSELLGV